MVKNDYRRSLILLRGNAPGYSGHVRLERRTLMGSMYFGIRAPEDGAILQAALAGRDKSGYYACPLGELKRDARGQAMLGYTFDPRNICGRELEQYQLIVIVRTDDEACRVVLFGNLNGYADVNWERVLTAVCSLYEDFGSGSPVTELPEERPPEPPPRPRPEPQSPEPPPRPRPEVQLPEIPMRPRPQATADGDAQTEPGETGEAGEERGENPGETEIPPESGDTETEAEPASMRQTAGERLGIDLELPWPGAIEPLRSIFRSAPPETRTPEDGYVYVSAPMPEGCGYARCAVGLRAENGVPAAVSYALPAAYSPEPPAGLEDYIWKGNENEGWWTLEADVRSGERV